MTNYNLERKISLYIASLKETNVALQALRHAEGRVGQLQNRLDIEKESLDLWKQAHEMGSPLAVVEIEPAEKEIAGLERGLAIEARNVQEAQLEIEDVRAKWLDARPNMLAALSGATPEES